MREKVSTHSIKVSNKALKKKVTQINLLVKSSFLESIFHLQKPEKLFKKSSIFHNLDPEAIPQCRWERLEFKIVILTTNMSLGSA